MSNPYQVREWLKDLPPQQLKMYADGKNPADVPPWLAVAEMTRRQRMQQGMKTPPQGTIKDKIESQFDQQSQDEEMDDQAKLMSLLAQRQQQGQQAQGQQAQNAPTIPENVPQPEEQPQVQYAARGGRLNGVAGLPANIFKFAHGGIVAFKTGDPVEDPDAIKAESEAIDPKLVAPYLLRNTGLGNRPRTDPEAQKRELIAAIQADAERKAEKERIAQLGKPPGRYAGPEASAAWKSRVDEAKKIPIEDSYDPAVREVPNFPSNLPEKPADQRQNVVQEKRRAPVGIATRVLESPSATPSMPSIPVPDMNKNSFVQELMKFTQKQKEAVPTDQESRNKQLALNELLGIKSIGEGSEQRAQAERDEYNASKKERALNDLQALLSAGARRNATGRMQSGTMGETGVIRAEANRAADAAFNKAQRDREEALAQLRRAELVGDRDKIVAAREKVEGFNRELEKAQMHTFGNLAEMSVRNDATLYGQAMQNAQADRKYKLDLLAHQATLARIAAETNSTEKQIEKMVLSDDPKYKPVIDRYMSYKSGIRGGEVREDAEVRKWVELFTKGNPLGALVNPETKKPYTPEEQQTNLIKLENLARKIVRGEVKPPSDKGVDTTGWGQPVNITKPTR